MAQTKTKSPFAGKAATKREQSGARTGSAEREQARRFGGNGLSRTAMLFRIATMAGHRLTVPELNRIRIHFGLEPKTKLVKHWGGKRDWHKSHYRYKFRQFGYAAEPDSHDVYYFPDTVRHPIMERNAQKYGFKILPAEEDFLNEE